MQRHKNMHLCCLRVLPHTLTQLSFSRFSRDILTSIFIINKKTTTLECRTPSNSTEKLEMFMWVAKKAKGSGPSSAPRSPEEMFL